MDRNFQAQPIPLKTFDWDEAAREQILPDVIQAIIAICIIEMATEDNYAPAVSTRAARQHPEISRFIPSWLVEEVRHAEILQRYLLARGVLDFNPRDRTRAMKVAMARGRIGNWILCTLVGKRALAVHMAWGAVNEWSARAIYLGIADNHPDTVLAEICMKLAGQERNHATTYGRIAREEMGTSRFRIWLVRFLLAHVWTPVGTGMVSRSQLAIVARVASRPDKVKEADDRLEKAVPVLAGMRILTRATTALLVE